MQVVATAGHVDHGKSTLIRSLTGMEPDRWSEERRRGLTIDLGFAWTTMDDGCTVAFVDVPGHERFVPNMLAGIGPVAAVMFVVAADEGWMPQSTEHLQALDALGVRHGLLVVTRSDLADPERASAEAREQIQGTSLSDIPTVHVSGATGQGVDELRRALDTLAHRLPPPDQDADLRLWVDRAFTIRGAGTVVTGTLSAGSLWVGRQLELHPTGKQVTVRGLQSLGADHTHVDAVTRVAVNLRGVELEDVHRGDALLAPQRWCSADVLDVRLRGAAAKELPRELTLHAGSTAVTARVRPLGQDTARLSLRRGLPLRIGDHALLRDPGSHVIASGVVVLDVSPPPLTRRGAARQRAQQLATMDDRADGAAELRRRRLVRADELQAMGAAVPPEALRAGEWLLDRDHSDELGRRLVEVLTRHQDDRPLEDGMPAEAVRRALDLPDAALLTAVRDASGRDISLQAGRVRLGPTPLPARVREALSTVRDRLRANPFDAPTADELSGLGLGERETAAAERAGELLRVAPGIVLLPGADREAVRHLSDLPSPFTLSQARKILGTTRRVAVPLLELLAREGYTERLPDGTHRLR